MTVPEDAARSHNPLARQIAAWQRGVQNEIFFWNRWFETRGLEWPSDFEDRIQVNRELKPWTLEGLALPTVPRVLDVGAGPLTVLGTRYHNVDIDLTATDPLAPVYAELARKYGVVRPVETVQAFAEDLSCYFESESFDLVYCQNALDHSFDPLRGIEEMYKVARPKGRILLVHRANEAEFESYEGFHQWNFDSKDGCFIIWNKEILVNISDIFKERADVTAQRVGDGLTVRIEKKGLPVGDRSSEVRKRVCELLAAQLEAQML